jgi:DNA-binding LytR/AlgR family response regulator
MTEFFFIKDGPEYVKILFTSILYIQADNKYCTIVTTRRKYMVLQSINSFEKMLPAKIFCRIHRSYIVSLIHTVSFNHTSVNVSEVHLPIGKQYKSVLPKRVTVLSENGPYINLSDVDVMNLFSAGPN